MPADADQLARFKAALADRYRVERELGHGGMALVYLAEDVKNHRRVAIKVLRPEIAAALGPERFLREIATVAQLTHPNILPLHDSGDAAGLLYYVTPYLEGESLRDRLAREHQLPIDVALHITHEVADALGYAHSHGIVHRDIKPENILFQAGHAVMSDFGIARAVTSAGGETLTETGIAIGTPAYMSPEQASGEKDVDARSDIYSLGCVLYEILAGEPPFTGPTAQAIVAKKLSGPTPRVSVLRKTVPAAVDAALAKALAPTPADRFATVQQFAAALPLQGEGYATSPPLQRRAWLRRRWLAAGAAAVIVGIGVTVLFLRSRNRGPAAAPNSVAVLYFDYLSRDTADAYLADGLTEELILRLGQITRLAVRSRAAVTHSRRMSGDRLAYGRALGVAHLVDGSVRRAGNRLRVTIELVRVRDGGRIWGDSYDRSATDLLAIEDDIAPRVAAAIAGRLLPGERARLAQSPTRIPVAYDHFLRGNYYLGQRTPSATSRALREYGISFSLDTTFTRAVGRIAFTYALLLDWGWSEPDAPAESLLARGLAAASKALQRDSDTSDGWMARGLLLTFEHPRTYQGVRQAFERATALDPDNAEAWHWYGTKLMDLDDDSAVDAFKHALAIEADRPITLYILARLRLQQRRLDEAHRWADSALKLDPGFGVGYALRAMIDYHRGATTALRTDAETAVLLLGDSVISEAVMVLAAMREGDTTGARARAQSLQSRIRRRGQPSPSQGLFAGVASVAIGDHNAALDLLEAVIPRGAGLWSRLHAPGFDALRANQRFVRLVEESRPL